MIGERVFERPLITMMLRNRQELGLSSEQVQDLENLRDGYQREAIRYQADIRIAEVELQSLLKADAVDLERVKVKLQEIEHLTTELRLARIRAIGQGKALLSSEQHEKLQALLGGSRYSRLGDEQFSEPTEDQP
jgi:Spy/CpxP family protein refolding chaperone